VILYDLAAQISVRKLRYLAWGYAARRIVRKIRPHVLHAHQVANAGWLSTIVGYHPLIVTAWGSDLLIGPQRSWIQRQLARLVLRRADYVTCVSQNLAQTALSLGVDSDRLEVAPWGIDTDVFHPVPDSTKDALRAQLGLGAGPIVSSIRKVQDVYNPLDIARAIPLVLEQIPNVQFIIRTHKYNQSVLTQFQTVIQKYQAAGSVQYIGDLPNDNAVADLYRVADVVVSVPSSDGTPSSVLEALACGTVPVLSDIPALRAWIQHGREGLFIPVGDVGAISTAIVRLLVDKTMREKLRSNALRLVRQRADSKVLMRRSEEIYRRLIEESKSE
jgi:glycosyltransferase involved in cell wall biosynthesis